MLYGLKVLRFVAQVLAGVVFFVVATGQFGFRYSVVEMQGLRAQIRQPCPCSLSAMQMPKAVGAKQTRTRQVASVTN